MEISLLSRRLTLEVHTEGEGWGDCLPLKQAEMQRTQLPILLNIVLLLTFVKHTEK